MITSQILQQLKQIGKANNWDAIYDVGYFNGRPLYLLRNSNIPHGAKTGRPHLYSLTLTGSVFALDDEQIHKATVSYKGFSKRLQ